MMADVIDIKQISDHISIRPCAFIFTVDETAAKGFVASDHLGNSAFDYPVFVDPIKNPIPFLHEAIRLGKKDFKAMMRRAYLGKKSVMVGQKEVLWIDYESIFVADKCYTGKPKTAKPKTATVLEAHLG